MKFTSSYISESIEKDNIFSLPQLVDKEKKHLRSKYLELLYDLGEIRIDGKRLVDCLEIRPNFSYWWMTQLSEKCNAIKSPQINNAIKSNPTNLYPNLCDSVLRSVSS